VANLILASASPRRRKLLAQAGYDFAVYNAFVAELSRSELSLRELTTANATRKALAVPRTMPGAVVLAADTLVSLDGEIIGKPSDFECARAILRRLSGRIHEVCTSVFIGAVCPSAPRFASFAEISHVAFRRLSESAISVYLAKINPLDKAGAYAVQGAGREVIASIGGSITNVIGLPMERTMEALNRFGIRPRS
jgi:septum formation protein